MIKVQFVLLFALICNVCLGQSIRRSEINKYSVEGTSKQVKLAKKYSEEYVLNKKGELEIITIKEYPDTPQDSLWLKIQNWVLSSSSNSQSSVQYMDEKAGVIVERCYIPEIARRTMGDNKYKVSIRPLLKFEFKQGKIRFTFSLQNYEVLKINDDSGYAIMLGGGFGVTGKGVTQKAILWNIFNCYPYNDIYPKVTSARAYINSIACYKVLLDQMDKVINKPLEKKEDFDW